MRGRPISTTTCRTPRRTTSGRRRRSGSRRTDASPISSSASAPAGRSAASGGTSRSATRPSRSGASIPTAPCSRNTRRRASSTRTRSTRTSPKGSVRTSCPRNVDFAMIDHFEKVTDKDAAIMTRRLAREEGIWVGNSAGAAMAGVVQLADHFGPRRHRRRRLPRPRLALHGQDVQRRVDAVEGVSRGVGHDRPRPGGARRVRRAVHDRGGAAGGGGDPRHERPRLLADLRDQGRAVSSAR